MSATRRMTDLEFAKRARKVHGKKYHYHRTDLAQHSVPGKGSCALIVCPTHGDFIQSVGAHLKGSGCRECDKAKRSTGIGEFLKRAREKHGNKYDYRKTVYVNARTKVTITCKKHGDFSQLPNSHVDQRGYGCPKCGVQDLLVNRYRATHKRMTLPDGREVKLQGYEPLAIERLLKTIRSDQLRFGKDIPFIRYKFDGDHQYFPDVRYGKTLVEVKSLYTWMVSREKNIAKLRAANKAGYTVRLMVFDDRGNCVVDRKKSPDGKVNEMISKELKFYRNVQTVINHQKG